MLKSALRHDNLVFGRYLDKEPEKARAMNNGEVKYQLEDAPNTLRIQWVVLLSKALSVPFILGYLLCQSGRISWILTGIMILLAALRLLIPMLFQKKLAGGQVTPGGLAAMYAFLSVVQTVFNDIVTIIRDYPLIFNAAERVCEFYRDPENTDGLRIGHFTGIEARKVSFSYMDRTVFRNLNFSVSVGDKIAILGGNGRENLL